MKVDVLFGKGKVEVELPSNAKVKVIRKPDMPILADPSGAIKRALHEPVACQSLGELGKVANSACIAICDITRPVPNSLFLRPMIEMLVAAGMELEKISIVVATGLHRPNEGSELEELIGDPWVMNNVRIVNHFAREDSQHVDLGVTPTRGTVVKLDRRFVDADLRIVTGLVEPHFMAGYSGGRKVVAPGLAHAETITTFHSARFMGNANARNCNLSDNPLHEEQLEILKLLGPCYALNTVIDENRQLSFANFGEVITSHQEAIKFVRGYCEIPVDRKYSTVITSAAGYPLDKTYYQTVKGMVGPIGIMASGGDLIILSECSEGIGSEEFRQAQSRLVEQGDSAFLEDLWGKSHADIDEWQTQMLLKPKQLGHIHLFCNGLSEEDHLLTGVDRVRDLKNTIANCVQRSSDRSVAVIPEGPYVIPFVRESMSVGG